MTVSGAALEVELERSGEHGTPTSAWRAIASSVEGKIGLALGLVMLVVIAFGRFFTPHSPTDFGLSSAGPSSDHLLGTDSLGRDVLSRLLVGGDTVLVVPLLAVSISFLTGGALGLIGGYLRNRWDLLIARVFDLLLTLPPLLLVLVLIAGLGTSRAVLVATVALVFVPRVGRVLRGATQGVVTNDYVAAAQARGERMWAIVLREVLPNIAAPAIADFALRLTYGIIFVSTLNFLGLGAQPPEPDWGLMVAESRGIITIAPLAALAPAAGIAGLAVSFNLVADALTRHLTRDVSSEAPPL